MAARSPCFTRWWLETCVDLTNSSRNARGRPCVLSSRSACETGTDSMASRSRHGQTLSRECKTGVPQRFLEQNQTAFWQLEETLRRPVGAHSHRETRSYKGILLATLLRRLRWSSASTASSLSGRRLLNACLFVFQAATITHSGPLPRVAQTDVVIVVVLCSREAVCFACRAWLDSQLKHLPAAPRAPPQSANRQPRGLVVPHIV